MKTFHLLYCKAHIYFVAPVLRAWLGFSSNWGHHSGSSSDRKLEIPMNWSQLDRFWVDTDLVSLKPICLYQRAGVNFVAGY
jgi:hypothetical protein